jgi:FkbM family methyltransferase
MELHSNTGAHFTKWVVREGLLERPFVLIDVGVQGGESPRWRALGDHLVVHGFDAIEEAIVALRRQNHSPHRHYHFMALGAIDGEQLFYFDASNPYSSSFYKQGETRFSDCGPSEQTRVVQVRSLDSLFAEGMLPLADFVKIDVEGYEKYVLSGGKKYLKGTLGLESETALTVSVEYPRTHFGKLSEAALENHQRVFDIEFNRVPRASFQRALVRESRTPIEANFSVGRPATLNVLFCRDLIEEAKYPGHYSDPPPPLDIDGIIKQIIVYELYGLNDVAIDTMEWLSDRIGGRIDVDKAVRLLADPSCRTPDAFVMRIRELESEVKQVRQAHTEAMAEASSILEAHRQASSERIMELLRENEAHRQASFRRIIELLQENEALKRPLAWIRMVLPRPVKRLLRLLLVSGRKSGQ